MRQHQIFVILALLIFCTPGFSQQEVSHSFYITANTGVAEENSSDAIFSAINIASKDEAAASLLLLGNITPEEGYPTGDAQRQKAEEYLQQHLLEPTKNFNGNVIFTPGVNEWNKGAPESIDDLETYLQDNSNRKAEFWPDDGCPLEEEEINENVVLITVDSQWFLENWDDHPEINLECEIKNREQFFIQFKDDLKDNYGKTKVIAIHHPVMSSSRFGFLDRIGGFTPQSFEHQKYRKLRKRLETLASLYDDVIFVSGSNRNLQFLDNERNPQIISGAAAETESARAVEDHHFGSNEHGFAKLIIYKDGSSKVEFYGVNRDSTTLLFEQNIERERPSLEEISSIPEKRIGPSLLSSIYTKEETDKGRFHQWIWGDTYREIYSREIEAPVLYLDTLQGNLRPLKEGGGQQSRSLRFIDENEHEYTIRALRKSPLRYVQADLVKENYIGDFLNDTYIERSILDFYTSSYPYARFAVAGLYDTLDVYHIDPQIYYIPKQESLGIHNNEYGDELYMLEPHVGSENKEIGNFGSPDDIISTMDLLLETRENKNAKVDESSYIKARLIDLAIGDWDRHEDQWRWSEFEEDNGEKIYYPIPRDHDFAFSRYDGLLLSLVKAFVPEIRKMQSYTKEISDLKRLTWSGYPLDQRFIRTASWDEWEEQVRFIQNNLTNQVIETAFANLPKEAQGTDTRNIQSILKHRRDNLMNIAREYYDYLREFEVVTGTDEDDNFEITRKKAGITTLKLSSEGEQVLYKEYNSENTDEIWIYGLDGEDTFSISGDGNDKIKIKTLGGTGHDTYDFSNPGKVKLYDYKSRESTITNKSSRKWLVDSYDINRYDYTKRKYSQNQVLPYVDFVPDAGFSVGVRDIFTTYGLFRNPFTTQHRFGANYYFATNGYELDYSAEFAHLFYKWNFGIEGRYTSPNYFLNYFGTGNNTVYNREDVERRYNRVKIQQWHIAPSIIWRNEAGASFYFKPMLESEEVTSTGEDFISDVFSPENDIFDQQLYAGVEANYNYYNKNNASFPSLGMEFDITAGYKSNVDEHNNRFGYVEPMVSFNYPLVSSGFAAIATKIGGEAIIGDRYEFYHAATIGGNNSLRGYRNHRFNGKNSFYHSTDIRSAFALLETKFIPIILGASVGFDYGRVWTENDSSNRWHNNYGGSLWINALYTVTGQIGFYRGGDGNRLTFTLNFKY